MSESLGGSKGRKSGLLAGTQLVQTARAASARQNGSILGGGMGRAQTARGPSPSPGQRLGGTLGGTFGGPGPKARPASAPRERGAPNYTFAGAKTGGSPGDAKARVEELRQIKEAQYWGRPMPVKRQLPSYWSVATHGEPFNDVRLATGAVSNVYQVLEPASNKQKNQEQATVGPATEQLAALRKSLVDGKRYFNRSDLTPIDADEDAEPLSTPDRVFLMQKLSPTQRIHALQYCLDRDMRGADFVPWTQMVWDKLDSRFWRRNHMMAIRLAVQKLENMMRRHLQYLAEQRCQAARAPAARTKDILIQEFWRVDPDDTGLVSVAQFLQVWQARLCLLQYEDVTITAPGSSKSRMTLKPGSRFILDESMASAIFIKYGFDKDGLLPYVTFAQALCAAPARLLGQELVIDKKEFGKHGLFDDIDVSYAVADAKIIYPKCETGVFPPSGFDERTAYRSRMLPRGHMWLEHVYGYAGHEINCSNIFYTHNTTESCTEIVYYTGCVGVVFNKEAWAAGKPSQKYFFGHDNDIGCLTIHPNRRFVATGQQKATGPQNVPFVCIWDVDTCNQLQRLDHDPKDREVLAVCFSGNINATTEDKLGGDILVTVTGDDKHSIYVWKWMLNANKFCKAVNIPGWCYGPTKKLEALTTAGLYYANPERYDLNKPKKQPKVLPGDPRPKQKFEKKPWAKWPKGEAVHKAAKTLDHPILNRIRDPKLKIDPEWEFGYCVELPRSKNDKTSEFECIGPGCNGTPPMVYGVVWNPLRPSDGRRGSEFCSYGVKHLKTWIVNDQGKWQGTSASFGNAHIENVLSACYVPALHYMAAPGDSCILSGFASGQIGLWIPPYPTRAGSTYQLTKKFDAHAPGALVRLNDGTQVYGGVRVIKLKADPTGQTAGRILLTGGSDGYVMQWALEEVGGNRKDGTPIKGVNLRCLGTADEHGGPNRFRLDAPSATYDAAAPARVVALDCHRAKPLEFVAGTSDCDVWEVDEHCRVMIEGQEEDMWRVATHPTDPNIFATTCESGKVRLWNASKFDVVVSTNVGFPITGITFSCEKYGSSTYGNDSRTNYHIAVGSKGAYSLGDWHKIAILDSTNMQPLKVLKEPCAQVTELKYSPAGGPGFLAAGCADMRIYIYNAKNDYQFVSRCTGHSGSVDHIDWSLPISLPGSKLHGEMIIMACDASANLLYWDPKTGKKIPYNQRDAAMSTWTSKLGFPVMGIWPDNSSLDDINSVCRSARGGPTFDIELANQSKDPAACVDLAGEEDSADGVPGGGYLTVADDYSTIRLFSFPVVWDDAPYKAFRGHSSHVMCVRFTCDDRLVVSAGGHDRGIYQWRTCLMNGEDLEKDKLVMAAWVHALTERRDGEDCLEPKPGVEWAPLDPDGKVYGPKAVAEQMAQQQAALASGSIPGTPATPSRRMSFIGGLPAEMTTTPKATFAGGGMVSFSGRSPNAPDEEKVFTPGRATDVDHD